MSNPLWRVRALCQVPAVVRGLSIEPLIGPICSRHLQISTPCGYHCDPDENLGGHHDHQNFAQWIQWLIVGGESGPRARPMQPLWARQLRDFCSEMGVAFHFKQWGEWAPDSSAATIDDDPHPMMRMGKKAAGRELDGATWNESPAAHLVPAS